jgi:hypothetical protein
VAGQALDIAVVSKERINMTNNNVSYFLSLDEAFDAIKSEGNDDDIIKNYDIRDDRYMQYDIGWINLRTNKKYMIKLKDLKKDLQKKRNNKKL